MERSRPDQPRVSFRVWLRGLRLKGVITKTSVRQWTYQLENLLAIHSPVTCAYLCAVNFCESSRSLYCLVAMRDLASLHEAMSGLSRVMLIRCKCEGVESSISLSLFIATDFPIFQLSSCIRDYSPALIFTFCN